jgi:Dynamin family
MWEAIPVQPSCSSERRYMQSIPSPIPHSYYLQGAGKSTVIERIMGKYLYPRHEHDILSTPLPIVIRLKHVPLNDTKLRQGPQGRRPGDWTVFKYGESVKELTDYQQVRYEIESTMRRLAREKRDRQLGPTEQEPNIYEEKIEITIHSHCVRDLILVDLPGLKRLPENADAQQKKAKVSWIGSGKESH